MELIPHSAMDVPATYRICVTGKIKNSWAQSLWGMTSRSVQEADEQPQTVLMGEIADQAALVGVINTLYNFGHTVVSVERVTVDVNSDENDKQKEG